MHRHHHLFERICTLENLIAAAKATLRGRRMRRPGSDFLADFEKEVVALHEQLLDGSYRHGGYHVSTGIVRRGQGSFSGGGQCTQADTASRGEG